VPAHLNYDLWTGPAPLLPYKAVMENRGWRAWMDRELNEELMGN